MLASAKLVSAHESDAVLVEGAIRGDDRAFSTLYSRHARYIAGVIYGITGDDGDLEDQVQEVFATASEKMKDLREPEYFRTWLVKIAVRLARRRSARKRRLGFLHFWAAKESDQSYDPRDRPVPLDLVRAMEGVSEKLLFPWILRRLEEQSLGEIAEACEVSVATVKRRINKAEQTIREKMHES
jgi:RNA polymerase sigma-70 factor (ECF subfamily)